jgi:broad specificity phosphatase PhoE
MRKNSKIEFKNKYYILRHGQTFWQTVNKDSAYPPKDSYKVRLTPLGEKQIKEAAKKLKDKGIDVIYSSDFFRTRQTAKIVAKELRVPVFFDSSLRDVNLGVYMGRKKEEFYRDFPQNSTESFYKVPPKGESWKDCQRRMLNFLKKIDKINNNKTILIISHGHPLWLLEGAVKNWSFGEMIKKRKSNYIQVGEFRKLI